MQVFANYENTNSLRVRAIVDSGSQINLLTLSSVQRLQLKMKKSHVQLYGADKTPLVQSLGLVKFNIHSIYNPSKMIQAEFYVVKSITTFLPIFENTRKYDEFSQLQLADPNYGSPAEIDALFGIGLWVMAIGERVKKSKDGLAAAQQTCFGWVIFMKGNEEQPHVPPKNLRILHVVKQEEKPSINELLQRFWEIEDLPKIKFLTNEEKECERIFVNTHSRDSSGRYVVFMPFNEKINLLGKSKSIALKQFFATERRMQRNESFRTNYIEFMKEFEDLGHLTKIKETKEDGYYTPHHGVITSDKFRVVFNASCATTTGISLNECQLVGEKLQADLAVTLMKFRSFEVAVTADVVKMFRQVEINNKHKKYQKILWRRSPNEPVGVYVLNRIAYGQAAAPFLAVRAMQQCARDHAKEFPLGAQAVLEMFYVDDALAGADSVEDAVELKNQLTKILSKGKFELAKWCSNKNIFYNSEERAFLELVESENKSVLGLRWLPQQDQFCYKIEAIRPKKLWTKREVLSQIGRLYDPNGYISPVVVVPKMLIQKIWQEQTDWDDVIPNSILSAWEEFLSDLPQVSEIRIPRWIGTKAIWQSELHGFCDASEKAYAAVVYIKTFDTDGQVTVRLVQSKTKVAPLKKLTIPRLELCGAYLLAKLIESIHIEFSKYVSNCFLWTDSEVALTWINKPPSQLKTFVANRVAAIQHKTTEKQFNWRWVAGEDNPADLASRGTTPQQIKHCSLWWNGPHWLKENESFWPKCELKPQNLRNEAIEEFKLVAHIVFHEPLTRGKWFAFKTSTSVSLLKAYSSFSKLKRVMAYVLRAIFNFKQKSEKNYLNGPLSAEELTASTVKLIQMDQSQTFSKELKQFDSQTEPKDGTLWLEPNNQILRLSGRVQNDSLSFDEQFPILLSPKGDIAPLLVHDAHLKTLHGGVQQVLQLIRQNYWIYQARQLAKRIIGKCPICFRYKIQLQRQLMAALPPSRTKPQRAFKFCGVDYMGPVGLSSKTGRNPTISKAYVCVFVCFVTRAIHLELVSNQTTAQFMQALRRFISRRGPVAQILSDNGTNFVGANNYLTEIYKKQREWATGEVSTVFKIKWKFITPNAPHHGGLHEAAVKSVKKHLQRVIGAQNLTFEEYYTLLTQVEACVNSRPISALSDDPSDLSALTPAHFLIGEPLITLCEPENLIESKTSYLKRWEMVQQMHQHFWLRWHKEYLMQLSQRPKWHERMQNLKFGDLVIIQENNLHPSQWSLGRIVETYPGNDGLVRSVKLWTKNGFYTRPITKLGLLPID